MTYTQENLLSNPKFIEICDKIYNVSSDYSRMAKRWADLYTIHAKNATDNISFFSSPGRIEVCGNHTDHNNGKVVCSAVSVDSLAVVNPMDGKIIVESIGYPEVVVDINDLKINKNEYGKSEALVRGVLKGFVDRGYKIGGFYATTTSDVFKGAGMSSSAAFEVLIAEILNVYYNEGKITAVEKAIVSQFAENVYFGKPSGIMDQSAIAFGGISHMDFKDPKNPIVNKMDWNYDDLSVLVINCGGDHADLTDEYAAIRSEMEEVAQFFGKNQLRFVDEKLFYNSIADMRKKSISGRAILRAEHYFEENKRVDNIEEAIITGDKASFLENVTASGISSNIKLQNLHAQFDKEQTIPLALSLAEKYGAAAYRVHGGGFAGTILTFIAKNEEKQFVDNMAKVFGYDNIHSLKIRNFGTCKLDI